MIALKPALKQARLQLVADAIAGGKLRLYPAPQPTAGGTPSSALLAEIVLPTPAATVSGGTLTFSDVTDVQVVSDGIATWARFVDSAGGFVMDGTAGLAGTDILLGYVNLITGGFVRVISGTITE